MKLFAWWPWRRPEPEPEEQVLAAPPAVAVARADLGEPPPPAAPPGQGWTLYRHIETGAEIRALQMDHSFRLKRLDDEGVTEIFQGWPGDYVIKPEGRGRWGMRRDAFELQFDPAEG